MASLDEAISRNSPVGGGQHHPGCGHAQQAHAAVGEPGEQLHDVEVVDQGVGQLDQRLHNGGLSGHLSSLLSAWGADSPGAGPGSGLRRPW